MLWRRLNVRETSGEWGTSSIIQFRIETAASLPPAIFLAHVKKCFALLSIRYLSYPTLTPLP